MTRRLLVSYLTITAFVLAVLIIPLGFTFASRERDQLVVDVERDATVIAGLAEDELDQGSDVDLQAIADAYEDRTGGRVVIVDETGLSLADSSPRSPDARDFSTRPEFVAALRGDRADGERFSDTLGTSLIYVAVPVASGGQVHGAVRVTYPTSELDRRVRENWIRLGLLSVVVLGAVAAVGVLLARSVTRPVRDLERATRSLAEGDLDTRVPITAGPPELRALGHSFNEMAHRLESLVHSQQAFVADASHQLRTPLTALRLRLENLGPSVAPGDQGDLDATIDEADRLSRLVDGLLLLARFDGTRSPCATVDVAGIVRERQAHWAPLAEERGVALDSEVVDGLAAAVVPDALEQVLDNLIDNALDAAPPGTAVAISAHRAGDTVEVHVIDHGAGLDDTDRERAFDRFWRGPSAVPGGSGIGLAVVRQLAEACGGRVELIAAAPQGIDATVTLMEEAPGGTVRSAL